MYDTSCRLICTTRLQTFDGLLFFNKHLMGYTLIYPTRKNIVLNCRYIDGESGGARSNNDFSFFYLFISFINYDFFSGLIKYLTLYIYFKCSI
jgi:hypothetical protein